MKNRVHPFRFGSHWLLPLLCALALAIPAVTAARPFTPQAAQSATAKRPLTHQDYDQWRSIQGQQLSRDGKWLTYSLMPQDGDGEVVVRNLATGNEYRYGRGWRQPTPPPENAEAPTEPRAPGAGRGGGPTTRQSFTADNRYLVFAVEPNKADVLQARKAKQRPEEMPKNALGLMDLANGQVTRIEQVKSYQVPEDGAGFIAYQLEPKPEERPAADAPKPNNDEHNDAEADQQRGGGRGAGARPGGARKEYGSNLVLRKMADHSERTFADVLDYTFSRDAQSLVYTVSARKEETNGVFVVASGTDAAPVELLAGKGKYARLTWDEEQTQLAFISDRDDAAAKQPKFKLYHWKRSTSPNVAKDAAAKAAEIVSIATPNFRAGFVLSDRAALNFSRAGGRIFFGVAPPPEPEKDAAADAAGNEEKVVVDLWHWRDDYIQPMQKVRAEQERNKSYRAVYHLADGKLVQLADATMEDVAPTGDGRWALGQDNRAYRRLAGHDANYADVYLVNTADGSRKELLKQFRPNQSNPSWSPNGKYALCYDGKDWLTISIPDGRVVNLTAQLGVNFWQEDHDTPSVPGAYGSGGWVKDDQFVLLYDQYDIWQIAPDGSAAKNLTDGVGRKEKLEFRIVRLEPDRGTDRGIDPAKPLLLSAENQWTRDDGFYRDRLDGGLPEKLVMAAKSFGRPTKAKDADVLLLTAARFDQYPDLHVTNANFASLKRVSAAGKQKDQYSWGAAELVRFKNSDGVPLSGILMKPDNFDPTKKYPLIVYIYEQLSQGLHRFVNPSPGTSINASYYVSNGYLVLQPDIVYTIGYPGQSALKCVLPAIQAVVDKGFVNENAIGIQGHSWGGYQIAYMVTQTNRFKAAAPGALVGNMTSAYSGIRWGTGLPRQFQYERTQSRIGGSLWEYPMRFIENSPVFHAPRVQTPIIMLHNDADDAVPWYQGIEYYLALRRLNKEVYLFNYNGEPHGLRRRQNQQDYTMRMQQFFDHHLKGAAKPEWMERGIPYLEREQEKEKYKPASDVLSGTGK